MTLRLRIHPSPWVAEFTPGAVVRVGRDRSADVRVGHHRIGGRWTVSKAHAEVRWDGSRWSTVNVSARTGLLSVYEPGYEELPLEPGRPWSPVRHRWAYALGRPGHRFHVVCSTDDHRLASAADGAAPAPGTLEAPTGDDGGVDGGDDVDATVSLDEVIALPLTALERDVLLAYYGEFAALPRPPVLAPRSHDDAANRLGRSRDSTRKAIERVNDKIARAPGAPPIASGRNVSTEIGRWLARSGALDASP